MSCMNTTMIGTGKRENHIDSAAAGNGDVAGTITFRRSC